MAVIFEVLDLMRGVRHCKQFGADNEANDGGGVEEFEVRGEKF